MSNWELKLIAELDCMEIEDLESVLSCIKRQILNFNFDIVY